MLTFDGKLLLVIPDSRGVMREYGWEVLPLVGTAFAVRLTRLDTGAVYVVRRHKYGWSCSCPAARWRRGACKHVGAAKALEALARRFAGDNRGVARGGVA